ncbi:PPOX class F420-dependent oxidoreductase [Streptacidiphilus sp. PAMC 29251]
MNFTDAELAYFRTQRLGRLATLAGDGTLQNNAVCYHANTDIGTIDIDGWNLGASRKFRNVAKTGEVAFIIDDLTSVDPWKVRGIEIRGRAEALTGQDRGSEHVGAELIRIRPRTIFTWGIEPDAAGMTRRSA